MKELDFEKYDSDFTWDKTLNFPIPTLNYITRRTGEDLMVSYDTEEKAKGAVIGVVRSAKNYLFNKRRDVKEWEYQLKRDEELVYLVLEFLLEFLNFALIVGDYDQYFKANNVALKSYGLENAKLNLLGGRKVIPFR